VTMTINIEASRTAVHNTNHQTRSMVEKTRMSTTVKVSKKQVINVDENEPIVEDDSSEEKEVWPPKRGKK
jgi:hypothetical protein